MINYLWKCKDCEYCKIDNEHQIEECCECGSTNIGEFHEEQITAQGNKYS